MPFKSQAQRRWMHANEPEMAKEWEKHTPKGKKLPNRAKKKKKTKVHNESAFEVKLHVALNELKL